MRGNDWPAERSELAAKLWHEGLTAAQIAHRIGVVTRAAVIGKLFRLGLLGKRPKRERTAAEILQRQAARKSANQKRWRENTRIRFGNGCAPPLPMEPERGDPILSAPVPTPPDGKPVPFLDTTFGQCRFIVDEQQNCCGAQTKEIAGSWCAYHHRVVFEPKRKLYVSKSQSDVGYAA